ncbi:3-deoxy-7-phosphoheptulonate synthase [Vibrio caribbeanicus]|uniref:Phospho-2-dehydro-3-deoxyheptonate aldolase n=1 Tax=Vibrio caribbeanicus ATCC BAA-2122 TaxID=796620 RepID=E3BG98_9VIBR|nr:3-deoxy-7-phosphoheptulonate synthase [Vibrio caribbeanicus]EFP97911.1 phospho-2-dehydro-3-deoxyheptonate aldolase [Vibrio caribbeanicus ATCC BAA-2122]
MNNLSAQESELSNVNISEERVLITPEELKNKLPLSERACRFIQDSRETVANIIHKRDHRLLVVCGPCSIHDIDAARDYAKRLKVLAEQLSDELYLVMRVYFEKPRTTVGWKGLINDPHLDGSFDIEHGLHVGRELLVELAEMEIPLATEALDPISPQYLADTFSWAAIGARTTESQTHREMASGLSMPIGFKNGTDGNLATAINAMQAASSSHRFMGINRLGQVALLTTQGNQDGHVILRGGKKPNYDTISVNQCEQEMAKSGLEASLMVDCSHANSNKDFRRQSIVVKDVIEQIKAGNRSIIGLMLESHINEGNQSANESNDDLEYGVSITDACIDWATTETLLRYTNQQLKPFLVKRTNKEE